MRVDTSLSGAKRDPKLTDEEPPTNQNQRSRNLSHLSSPSRSTRRESSEADMSTMPTSTSAHRTTKFEMIRQGSIELVLYSEVVLPSGPSRTRNQARVGGPAEGKEKDRLDKQGRVEAGLEEVGKKVEKDVRSGLSALSIDEGGDGITGTSTGAIGSDLVIQETRDSVPGDERYPQGAAQEDRTVWARYLGSDGRLRECAIEGM